MHRVDEHADSPHGGSCRNTYDKKITLKASLQTLTSVVRSSHKTCVRAASILPSTVCGAQQRGSGRGRVSARAGCRCSGETTCCRDSSCCSSSSSLTDQRRREARRKPPLQQRTRPSTRHCVVLTRKGKLALVYSRQKRGQRDAMNQIEGGCSRRKSACPRPKNRGGVCTVRRSDTGGRERDKLHYDCTDAKPGRKKARLSRFGRKRSERAHRLAGARTTLAFQIN